MRFIFTAFAALAAVGSISAHAATIEVGPGRKYTTLAAASAATANGDTVVIYPGTYTSGATWYDSNITIKGAPGTTASQVVVKGGAVGGKGLFVTKGANITIIGLKFEGARVADGNGAGIRAEGPNLTVRDSIFYNNENGILSTPAASPGGTLTVQNCRFDYHRSHASGRIGHSLYVGNTQQDALVVTGSTFTRNYVGHYIKSRAKSTTVTDTTIDDTNGTASYLIDVPNGGAANISRNKLTKGANASNKSVAVALGFEGAVNPFGPVKVIGNNFVNKTGTQTTFVYDKTPSKVEMSGNTSTGNNHPFIALRDQ